MSSVSKSQQHTGAESKRITPLKIDIGSASRPCSSTNDKIETALTKRSDFLYHVFPRSSRSGVMMHRKSIARVAKPEQRRSTLLSIRRSKPRIAFHKVIHSFFSTTPVKVKPYSGHTRKTSSTSSLISKPGSVHHGSMQSLELISPQAFIFSGPSLRSAYASSIGISTPQMPSQVDLCGNRRDSQQFENSFKQQSHRRARSESISNGSASILEVSTLDPSDEGSMTRSMSDILLELDRSYDELEYLIPEDVDEDDCLRPHYRESSESVATQQSSGFCYSLPLSLLKLLPNYFDRSTTSAIRLTCRSWYCALNSVAPPKLPPLCRLPTEILQQIYYYLEPREFNAARHTCRTWMSASLNRSLLVAMLKRGGWWSGVEMSTIEHDEWPLSCSLARECSLSFGWTGNGLRIHTELSSSTTPLVKVAGTDFGELASGSAGPLGRHSVGLVFTTSVCGRFLLVAEGGMIRVYELQGRDLLPLTSIICPRRVLAMSMDATTHRFAIAALLEGRMGLVCDLQLTSGFDEGSASALPDNSIGSRRHAYHTAASSTEAGTTIFTSRLSEPGTRIDPEDRASISRAASQSSDERNAEVFDAIDVQTQNEGINLHGINDAANYERNYINGHWNMTIRGAPSIATTGTDETCESQTQSQSPTIPVETGPRSIYRHLCNEDDPPRSVAICPQRRCVAFGCSAGIELHWVDALTGHDLNRWFPLTAPSDFLYFLPPRPGFDSAKKLRLISSAAHRSERPAIRRRFFSHKPALGLFDSYSQNYATTNCDHYRAVPLSDGHHVLFTEPIACKLFLGSDAPLGGPIKLLRKIVFESPNTGDIPRLYTAAADLSWGARVVAVYGDTVVFYSVPPDVFELSRLEQRAESWDFYAAPPFTSEGRSEDHWINWCEKPPEANLPEQHPDRARIWPMPIRGTVIGTWDGIVDLAISTQPDITIWAFGMHGRSITWQIPHLDEPSAVIERCVGRDGLVNDGYSVDVDGCVNMTDAPLPKPKVSGERAFGVDGHASGVLPRIIHHALHLDMDNALKTLDITSSGEVWYDHDGNVYLQDSGKPVR